MREAIKNYSYKPEPRFKRGKRERKNSDYYGLEWEMELSSSSAFEERELAYELMELASEYAYCKSDGSITDGCELVTEPITLKAWEETYFDELKKIENKMKEMKCKESSKNAGIHIHFSRENLDDATIKKICYLLSKPSNYQYMINFCKRTKEKMNQWAGPYTYSESFANFDPFRKSRYKIVNLNNSNTIEFRCFGYTNKAEDIRAYIYAVNSIIAFCKACKNINLLKNIDMQKVLAFGNTEYMTDYLKKRKMFREEDTQCAL